jgi:hypothetical protein
MIHIASPIGMKAFNLVLRFLIELTCLAALAYGGATASVGGIPSLALAILAPLAAITVWGVWVAPRAMRRLSGRRLTALELVVLACACTLLVLAGAALPAALLALIAVANAKVLGHLERTAAD